MADEEMRSYVMEKQEDGYWVLVRPKRDWVPEWFWRILARWQIPCYEPFRHIFTRALLRRIG